MVRSRREATRSEREQMTNQQDRQAFEEWRLRELPHITAPEDNELLQLAFQAALRISEDRRKQEEPVAWVVVDEKGYPDYCASYPEACHEHINDAINIEQIDEASRWVVRGPLILRDKEQP